jgi:hypothetical protein
MPLVGAAATPVETHVHGLDLFGLDGVGDYTKGCGVVGLNGWLWLCPSHFCESIT